MSNPGTSHLHQTIISSGKAFWLVVGITSAMNFLMLTVPIYSLQIYDRVLTARSISTLAYLTLIACLLIAAYSFLEFVRLKVLLRLGNRFELTHATRLIHTCITQSAKSSAPSSSLLRDLAVIRSFIASPHGVSALLDIPIAIFFLIVVFLISPVLGAAMLTGAVGLVVIAYLTDRTTLEPIRLANEASQKAQNRAAEIVDRSEIVEALGMRNNLIAHWQEAARESLSYQSQSSDLVATNTAISRWSRLIISIAMTALGAYLAIQDKITMGAMIASSILLGRGLAPLESVIPLWRQVANVRLAWQRVSSTLTISDRAEQTLQLPKPLGRLTLEKVTYASPGSEQPIIKSLSFDLPAGAMLGIVGPVAAGKSTLAKLLCGVWKPQMGTVRMDGADVFQWPRDDFGKHVGYLPQGCELFVGSIKDNISRFSNGSAEAVIEAAQLAGVHELILRLPRGYDTIIGTHGVVLSGGTRQRIALARAIFGNPSLVVLDEPSASLDEEGEQALLASFRTLKEKRTTIVVISHQRNILRDADRIAVIVDGQLFKYGTRQELLPSESDQRHSI